MEGVATVAALESDQWLRDQLDILKIRSKLQPDKLAAIAGMSVASYYNRYNAPQEFRLRELRCLDRIAKRYGMRILQEG